MYSIEVLEAVKNAKNQVMAQAAKMNIRGKTPEEDIWLRRNQILQSYGKLHVSLKGIAQYEQRHAKLRHNLQLLQQNAKQLHYLSEVTFIVYTSYLFIWFSMNSIY
jgi:hypothetical protein